MTARDLPFERAALAAVRRVSWNRARVLLPCKVSGAGGAGYMEIGLRHPGDWLGGSRGESGCKA